MAHSFDDELKELAEGQLVGGVSEWKKPREVPRNIVKLIDKLGEGAFGVVFKAIVDETTTIGLPSYLAAVKTFEKPSQKELKEIYTEASVMAQVNHEHVVRLVSEMGI